MPQPIPSPLQPPLRPVPAAPALGALLLGLALAGTSTTAAAEPLQLQFADMQQSCQREAASTFRVNSRAVRTLEPERRPGNGYVVYGQTTTRGEDPLFFACTFDTGRRFLGVRPSGDQRASGSGRSEPLDLEQMPRFCRRMVAEEFKLNPRAISVEAAEKQRNDSYTVRAIARPVSGRTFESFECRFGSQGRYKRVERLD